MLWGLQHPSLAAEVCGDRMERFLSTLLMEAQADFKLLLISPLPIEPGAWVDDPQIAEESQRLSGCYQAVAQRLGIAFADAGAWGVGLTYDGVHFSEEGHLAFAKGIQTVLNNLC